MRDNRMAFIHWVIAKVITVVMRRNRQFGPSQTMRWVIIQGAVRRMA